MIPVSISFDMRVPDLGTAPQELYAAALDMCEYVDGKGFDFAWTMEHHGAPDGYLPSPLTMAAAIGARTKTMRLMAGVVILPLHDPVRVAEDMAVVDLISNGRLDVVFGAGYVPHEFQMFKRDLHARGKALDEGVPIIQRALSGERFTVDGREIFVRPLPVQQPMPIMMGGSVPIAAKRAARFGAGLCPMHPGIIPIYLEECEKLGRAPGRIVLNVAQLHISEDPDRTWNEIGPHVLQHFRSYAEMTGGVEEGSGSPYAGLDTVEKARASGMIKVVTPDEAVEICRHGEAMNAGVTLHPLMGGMKPKLAWESIELFLNKVMPRVRPQAS